MRLMRTPRAYFLTLLALLNVMVVLDKTAITVLLEPIKREFGLSDLQLALLNGTIFAACAGLGSIFLGRLADRMNRVRLLAVCLTVWSIASALCGLAQNYILLLLARALVGGAEGGGPPAALSIISDLYERKVRSTAMAVYSAGVPIVLLIDLTAVTWIAHAYGWRSAMLIAAVPGIILALLLLLTARDPRDGGSEIERARVSDVALRSVVRTIIERHSLLCVVIAAVMIYVGFASVSSWSFSFLVRSRGVSLHESGWQVALVMSVCGVAGGIAGGIVADALDKFDERWSPWMLAIFGATMALGISLLLLGDGWPVTLIALGLFAIGGNAWVGPTFALTQGLVEPEMRGRMSGILFFLSNIVGYGLGPILIGVLSDALEPTFGKQSLGVALFATIPFFVGAVLLFMRAAATIRTDFRFVPDPAAEGAVLSPA